MAEYRDKETGDVVERRMNVGNTYLIVRNGLIEYVDAKDFRARFEPVQPQPGSE